MSSSVSALGGQKVVKRRKPIDKVWVWGGEARYEVVHNKFCGMGWKVITDEKKEARCNLFWIDSATIHERFRHIQPWQIINHFPGTPNIARKNRMGQNLNRVAKVFPKEYSFYPRTWSLPSELADFKNQFDPTTGLGLNNRMFIIKPDAGCQGKGIHLVRSWDQVPQQDGVVAQVYVKKPLLIDGFKFDLRLYVLVTSVKPLRMYLFQDGLVRLCTEPYVKPNKQNMHELRMHLTNYAVNKNSDNFQAATTEDDDAGSKRTLQWFMQYIASEYGEKKAKYLWKRFGVLSVRTVLSILPTLSREYDLHFKSFYNVPVVLPDRKSYASTGLKCDNDKDVVVRKLNPKYCNEYSDYDEGVEEVNPPNVQVDGADNTTCEVKEDDDDEDDEDEEDDDGSEDEEDEAEDDKSNEDKSCRGSRCFEVLGVDIMIDSNLKPWLIEVNHLPSFGTDSPLDMDVKGRLMEEVLNLVPVLPDDEDAYTLYHKREAERRLTSERTTASSGKLRGKSMTEKEKKDIADKLERERYTRKRAEFLRERERMLERQKAEAAAAVAQAEEEERRRNEIIRINNANAEKHNRWLRNIYVLLAKIYTEYCPSKVNKIERLLDKYSGREEEFVSFVYDKYNVPYPIELEPREELEEIPPELTRPVEISRSDDASVSSESNLNGDAAVRPTRPVKSQSAGSKDGRRNRYGEVIRTPSPPQRRAPAAWRGDPEEEESFRQEVLNEHRPKEDDPRLQYEIDTLPSFYRIFPLFESDEAKEIREEEEDADDNDEVDEKEGDNEDGGESTSTAVVEKCEGWMDKDKEVKKKKKTPMWKSHEDVLCAVFLQDRRQTLRMKQPLGGQAKTSNTDSKDHLPALGDSSKSASTFGKSGGGRSLPGWKPPPPRKENKEPPKVPGQYQMDVASRLSKGLSSSRQQNDEDKLANNNYRSSKMIVSAKHRIYSNTCTSSGSAAGSIYTTSSIAAQVNSQTDVGGGNTGIAVGGHGVSSVPSSGGLLDPFKTHQDQYSTGYQGIDLSFNSRANGGRNGMNSRTGMPLPLSVPQKMFTFDNNVPPNTDFGETSLFGTQQCTPSNSTSRIHGNSK